MNSFPFSVCIMKDKRRNLEDYKERLCNLYFIVASAVGCTFSLI